MVKVAAAIVLLAATAVAAPGKPATDVPAAIVPSAVAAPQTPPTPNLMIRHAYEDSVRATRAAGRQVVFETDCDRDSAAAVMEAADVAADAIVAVAQQPDGARWLARITDVRVHPGPTTTATMERGVILITVNPAEGVSGRPVSPAIDRDALLQLVEYR